MAARRGGWVGRARTLGGQRFRSGYEADIAADLTRRGKPVHYEDRRLLYTTEHVYRPDWRIPTRSGREILVESKGRLTARDRSKLIAVRDANPDKDLRLLLQTPNARLHRGSRTTYGQWATNAGFIWAEGDSIPEAWFRE
jgi:hypothetical protein